VKNIVFNPPPTIKAFMRCDERIRFIRGPYGSAKTTGMIFEIVRRATQMPPDEDGVRRSRWLVTRLTTSQLKDTVLKSWLRWFPDGQMGYWRASDNTYWLRFNDVEAEVLFRPLESEADIARVLSLELTGAWIAECRDLPVSMVSDIFGRCGRFPDPRMSYWYGVFGETNPPDEGSEWYRVFEHLPQDENDLSSVLPCATFAQPTPVDDDLNLLPQAENAENLKPTYYQDMARGKTDEFIRVAVKGQYGINRRGKPVYKGSFRKDRHVHNGPIPIDPELPIVVGHDFGRTPAAIIAQPLVTEPRIHFLRELITDRRDSMGVERFVLTRLRPLLRSMFPSNPVIIVGDPSGARKNDSDEGSAFKKLKELGFTVRPARTNDPVVRINAVEELLSTYPHGDPMVLFDPSMRVSIEGFTHRYIYAEAKKDQYKEVPEKSHPVSDVHDAIQYAALFYLHGYDAQDWLPMMGHQATSVAYRPADAYTGY